MTLAKLIMVLLGVFVISLIVMLLEFYICILIDEINPYER